MCACSGGYRLDSQDGRTCEGECVNSVVCEYTNFCDLLHSFSIDIDECYEAALRDVELCGRSGQCVNTDGSYNCVCATGTTLKNGICQCRQNK